MALRRWTPPEDAVIRASFPNFGLAAAVLTWRTRAGIKDRASALGLRQPDFYWSKSNQELILRCVERGEGLSAITMRFPGKTKHSIARLVARLGKKGSWCGTPPSLNSPHLIITDIKQRCLDKGVPFKAISHAAGTKGLLKSNTIRKAGLSHARIAKAVELLGGELYAEWED